MVKTCEMIVVDSTGDESEQDCDRPACGTTEEGTRVCRSCGDEEARKGFQVKWDAPEAGQGSLFT